MNFNEYIIDEDDFGFYASLPEDERILFLYDLICEDAYGPGSVSAVDSKSLEMLDFDTVIKEFAKKITDVVNASIKQNMLVNVLFINTKVIVQSDSLNLLNESVTELFLDGYILKGVDMAPRIKEIFHVQKYCKMYDILGCEFKLSLN
jgi:hypothetical protein